MPSRKNAKHPGRRKDSRRLLLEPLEPRLLLSVWRNPVDALDVDGNGAVSSIDILQIINELNDPQFHDETRRLQIPPPADAPPPYLDVNCDGFVTHIDALILVNSLSAPPLPGPRIQLLQATTEISEGGTVDFGTIPLNVAVDKALTVHNSGTETLTLTPLDEGTFPAGFSLIDNIGRASLPSRNSTSFTIRLLSTSEGDFSGTISLANTDTGQNPFNLNVSGRVVATPDVQIVDDGDAGYHETGSGWTTATDNTAHQGDFRSHAAGSGQSKAVWSFDVAPGLFRVAATWSPQQNGATNAPFAVFDDRELVGTVGLDQRQPPQDFNDQDTDWEDLGEFFVSGTTLVVELSDDADGAVAADAVRVELITPWVATALPGSLIALPLEDLPESATEVAARFSDGLGFELDVPVIDVTESSVIVSVPPVVDPSTGTFGGGTVNVELLVDGVPLARPAIRDFEIQELPTPALPTGQTTVSYLQLLAGLAQQLQSLIPGTVLDTPEMNASLADQIPQLSDLAADLQRVVDDPQTLLVLDSFGGQSISVDIAHLATADRMIAAVLMAQGNLPARHCASTAAGGYVDALLNNPAAASAASSAYAAALLNCTLDNVLHSSRISAAAAQVFGAILDSTAVVGQQSLSVLQPAAANLPNAANGPALLGFVAGGHTTFLATAPPIATTAAPDPARIDRVSATLNTLVGTAEVVLEEADPPDVQEMLERIRDAVATLLLIAIGTRPNEIWINDAAPVVEGSDAIVEASFKVEAARNVLWGLPVIFQYSTESDNSPFSATPGDDYFERSGALGIISFFNKSTEVRIQIKDDDEVEDTESFRVKLDSVLTPPGSRIIEPKKGTGFILDADVEFSLSGDPGAVEGAQARYTLSVDGTVVDGETASVDVTLADIDTDSADYGDLHAALDAAILGTSIVRSGDTLTFDSSSPASIEIVLPIVDDDQQEGHEDFRVQLSDADNTAGAANLGTSEVQTTILDNDIKFSLSGSDEVIEGSQATYRLEVEGEVSDGHTASVDVTLVDVDTDNSDYGDFRAALDVAISGTSIQRSGDTLTFDSSSPASIQWVLPTADDDDQEDEVFQVQLSDASYTEGSAELGTSQVETTILALGGVIVSESGGSTDISEVDPDADSYTLQLTRMPTASVEITVTADAQSEVSQDGLFFARSQTFARIDLTPKTIFVRAIDDSADEDDPHPSTISHIISGPLLDPRYPPTLSIDSVVANVEDNDVALAGSFSGSSVDTIILPVPSPPPPFINITTYENNLSGTLTFVMEGDGTASNPYGGAMSGRGQNFALLRGQTVIGAPGTFTSPLNFGPVPIDSNGQQITAQGTGSMALPLNQSAPYQFRFAGTVSDGNVNDAQSSISGTLFVKFLASTGFGFFNEVEIAMNVGAQRTSDGAAEGEFAAAGVHPAAVGSADARPDRTAAEQENNSPARQRAAKLEAARAATNEPAPQQAARRVQRATRTAHDEELLSAIDALFGDGRFDSLLRDGIP